MSNAGQVALGIVGGIVGFYLGGPQGAVYGFQLGLAVGSVVSPTQLPGTFGPRLTDNRTTTSTLGATVVEIAGTDVTMGNVIWLGKIVETATTTEVGGKGGPEQSQTTYSYNQSIAVGLCKSLRGTGMKGIQQIFENGKLVYDIRPQQPDEDATAYANRQTESATYRAGFTLYLGTEDQLPDPTIEAEEGIGNVPGYRGLMYIVFPNRLLRDDQARRHPNWKFVVYDEGSEACPEAEDYSNEVVYPWAFGTKDVRNVCNEHQYQFTKGIHPIRDSLESALSDATSNNYPISVLRGFSPEIATSTGHLLPYFASETTFNTEKASFYLWYSPDMQKELDEPIYIPPDNPGLGLAECDWIRQRNPPFWWTGRAEDGNHEPHGIRQVPLFGGDPVTYGSLVTNPVAFCDLDPDSPGNEGREWHTEDAAITVTRIAQPPPAPCTMSGCGAGGYYPSGREGFCYDAAGVLIESTPWIRDDARTYHVLQRFVSGTPITYPLNPARPLGHAQYNDEAFWTQAYNDAVDGGLLPFGWTYGLEYPQTQSFGYYRNFTRCTADTDLVSIADIVRAICLRCSMPLDLIDVSDLEERYVNGYSLAKTMDGRSAIAPLRSVGFFDAVETNGRVAFPVRGKAPVRTLLLSDLGARDSGGDEQPPLITTKQQDDVELPRQLFVQYRDPERGYEVGEQPSPTRLITDAVNDMYVDVAVAISATQAAQAAEVLWADMWASRWQHSLAVGMPHLDLDPTDTLLVPVDGRNERMRIVAVDDNSLVIRQMQLLRDDDGSYVSEAIAEPSAVEPPTMIFYAATQAVMLDLPPLRADDNDPGFYVAVSRANNGNRWGGATIYRSSDGVAFQAQGSVANEALIGTVFSALPAAGWQTWDNGNELIVTLPRGSFETRTESDVLGGANALAIGAHGRWEIVQFVNAELIDNTRWRLTNLLRGRRGTDHNIGLSQAGDTAVLISGSGIIRQALSIDQVDIDYIYRAVTNGTQLGTGSDQTFAGDGEALKPFSPVHIHGVRDAGTGDLTISWTRRDRLLIDYVAGTPTPMSETVEDYEIDIIDNAGEVRRTISVSQTEAVYSAAMQITDFTGPQSQVQVRIYQISAAIGRGHYREAIV